MEDIVAALLKPILNAGPAVVAILLLIVGGVTYFAWKSTVAHRKERSDLMTKFQEQLEIDRKDLLDVIDKYQTGQMTVVQAINEIKVLIATIGAKI